MIAGRGLRACVLARVDELYENCSMVSQPADWSRQSRSTTPTHLHFEQVSVFMDVTEILREIDAEIRKLERVREILQESFGTSTRPQRKTRRRKTRSDNSVGSVRAVSPPLPTAVNITVVPPKTQREYRRRMKLPSATGRAIDVAISSKPVFVPRAIVASSSKGPAVSVEEPDLSKLEATFRKSLLGASAAHIGA